MNFLDKIGLTLLWKNIQSSIAKAMSYKVDKVAGKGLSTNDYTDEDKENINKVFKIDNASNKQLVINDKGEIVWDDVVGKVLTGHTVHITKDSSVIADEGATIFGDMRERAFEGRIVKGNIASGIYSHAEGEGTTAIGSYSHAEGFGTIARERGSHAEGIDTEAYGPHSHAEGSGSIAYGHGSHAEGVDTITNGRYSHAEGKDTSARGERSHAEGEGTITYGHGSHAEGLDTIANGDYSHTEGWNTVANGRYSHVKGKNNLIDKEDLYAYIVGNGSSDVSRSNAHTLDWDGNAWFQGAVKIGGTGQDDETAKELATQEYVANQIAAIEIPEEFSGSWNDLTDKPFGEISGEIITLDEAYIPDTIQRVGDDLILNSSTEGSTKKFKLTIDDSGVLTATEIVE